MDWTNATSTSAGILHPDEFARHASVERVNCAPELSAWVEYYWCLRWDLPPGTTYVSSVVPHPTCNLTVEHGRPRVGIGTDRVVVTGVTTRRFDVRVVDRGSVVGVKFRPGGLVALSDTDARSLTDRVVPARDVLSPELCDELRSITEATPNAAACAVVDRALMAVATGVVDPSYETVLELIDDMLRDRTLMRVAQLEQRHAIDRRRLQRLFASYIGVGPKWVLARYRMHDVITALDDGYDGTLVDLAVEYGWYDQAHFNRDFVGLIGVTPGAYRARRATSADCAQGHS